MSVLDEQFYNALERMEGVATESLLNDVFPPTAAHNVSARILRLGMAVTAFSLLEHYAKEKFSEIMLGVSQCSIRYSQFDDNLRRFITYHAVSGLANRASFMDRTTAISFVEDGIAKIAAFAGVPASYTALGFSPRGSNVGQADIETAFRAVGVQSVWTTLSAITHEIGSARVSLKQDYENLARTRHKSAHSPVHNVPTADLLTHIHISRITGIAVGVLTASVIRAYSSATTQKDVVASLSKISRSFRFLDEEQDGRWVERVTVGGGIIKRYNDRTAAIIGAKKRTGVRAIVVRDARQMPIALV